MRRLTPPKKKHKLKKPQRLPHIDGDFDLLAADFSLRRPGFAILRYNARDRTVRLFRKENINNKTGRHRNKPAGKCLCEIFDLLSELLLRKALKIYVRERAISRFNAETQALHRVTGIADFLLWQIKEVPWQELAAMSIKKLVTGNGASSKQQVAKYLQCYIGPHTYRCDDETDACACGIAWLLDNGYIDQRLPAEETLPDVVYAENSLDVGDYACPNNSKDEESSLL